MSGRRRTHLGGDRTADVDAPSRPRPRAGSPRRSTRSATRSSWWTPSGETVLRNRPPSGSTTPATPTRSPAGARRAARPARAAARSARGSSSCSARRRGVLSMTARPLFADGRPHRRGRDASVTSPRRAGSRRMRRDFVANVSHELKTPVGALAVLAETLAGVDDPDGRAPARGAHRDARPTASARIVDDLLDLGQIESHAAPREPVPVGELIDAAVERVEGAAAAAGSHARGDAVLGDARVRPAPDGERDRQPARQRVEVLGSRAGGVARRPRRRRLAQHRGARPRRRASRRATSTASSSASTASTGPGAARPVVPAWASRSSATSPTRTTATSPSSRARATARRSGSGSRSLATAAPLFVEDR